MTLANKMYNITTETNEKEKIISKNILNKIMNSAKKGYYYCHFNKDNVTQIDIIGLIYNGFNVIDQEMLDIIIVSWSN